MTTTIQLQDETLELLKKVKEQTHAKTYDDVIKNFMSMGAYAKLYRGFLGKKDMGYVLKDLRDKTNRY